MDQSAEFWAHERTFGGRAREFWWRIDVEGTLSIRRVESARKGSRGVAERTLTRDELARLEGFMADGAWHPLAGGAQGVRSGVVPGGLGGFLHVELGWSAQATVAASHLAVIMTKAGLWEWNGRKQGMLFRRADGAREGSSPASPPPSPRSRSRSRPRAGGGAEAPSEEEEEDRGRGRDRDRGRGEGRDRGRDRDRDRGGGGATSMGAVLVERLRAYYERCRAEAGKGRARGGAGAPQRHSEQGARQEPPRFNLAAKFRALSKSLRGRFEECGSGGKHGPEIGQRREGAVREFLRSQLPSEYGVTRGEVVSAMGEASRQMDVLIYDAPRAPVLLESEGSRLLAAESVYAAIEVKPRLTSTELRGAMANIRSVKALPRDAVLWPGGPMGGQPPPEPNPAPFGVVFSFESMGRRLVAEQLREEQEDVPPSLQVDCVCVLDEAVIYRSVDGPGMWMPAPSTCPARLECVPTGRDSLLFFYLLLHRDLSGKSLGPPDLMHYLLAMGLPPAEPV